MAKTKVDATEELLKKFPGARKLTQERFPSIDLRTKGAYIAAELFGSRIQKTSNGPATILQMKLVETNVEAQGWDRENRVAVPVKVEKDSMVDVKASTVLMSLLDHPIGTKFLIRYVGKVKPENGNEYHDFGIFILPK